METHWSADVYAHLSWEVKMARKLPGPVLQSLITARLARCGKPFDRHMDYCNAVTTMTWRYTKLSLLLAHMEASIHERGSAHNISAIEEFARGAANQWLKIAGGNKGSVLERLIRRCQASYGNGVCPCGTMMLEFGAFVGYNTSRLAAYGLVVSFEHDPVHACIAQHLLDLTAPPRLAEVWIGRVSDIIPRVTEARGSNATDLVFLDESGSTFHTDFARLESTSVPSPTMHAMADNTLRPGAPRFLVHWQNAIGHLPVIELLTIWSMAEFLEEAAGVEDWVAVISSDRVAHM